jgi:hypothetical protein
MEFIITGLFIIFFSYILLYSLYDILFKRSTIEGLENGDKEDDKEGDKEEDKDKKDSKSDIEIAQESSSMNDDANSKIEEGNEKHPNRTFNTATDLVEKNP